MRNLVIFIIIVGAGLFFYKKYFDQPKEITHPIYAEVHMTIGGPRGSGGRSIEAVTYMATADEKECQGLLSSFNSQQARLCPPDSCSVQQRECKTELAPRDLRLFDNQPTTVTYLSIARGTPEERETRMIFWGVSADTSDKLCQMVPDIQEGHKGQVRCIHGLLAN
jgi:hypothetical protein